MFPTLRISLDAALDPLLVRGMDNNDVPRSKSPSRRVFLSASAVTAVAAPLVASTATAHAADSRASGKAVASGASARAAQNPTIQACGRCSTRSIRSGSRASSRHWPPSTPAHRIEPDGPEPRNRRSDRLCHRADAGHCSHVRGPDDGAAADVYPARRQQHSRKPTSITNVIATLKGTASTERFYVVTGHLDSRCTNILDFTSDAPGADDDASGVAVALSSPGSSPPASSPARWCSRPSTAKRKACTAPRTWRSRWPRRATTCRACSAMIS